MSDVLLEVADGVAHLTLHRPDQGNAITLSLAQALTEALQEIGARDDVRVVLLDGAGPRFCTGGDVTSMAAATDRDAEVLALAHQAHEAVLLLHELELPVVAACRGAVAGAGLSLMLLADVVLAAPGTVLTTAYTAVGLSPDCGQSWLLPRAVGSSRALELTLSARRFDVAQAEAWGLVAQVVADDELDQEAMAYAARMASRTPYACGAARRLVRDQDTPGFRAHLDREAATIARLAAGPEAGTRLEAFAR